MGIVITPVAPSLLTDEIRLLERFVLIGQFHFGHDQPFVVAVELIHLKYMPAGLHQITGLVYNSRFTKVPSTLARLPQVFPSQTHNADSRHGGGPLMVR